MQSKSSAKCPVCGCTYTDENNILSIAAHQQCYACYEEVRHIMEDPYEMGYGES
jgi:hypothetical protein